MPCENIIDKIYLGDQFSKRLVNPDKELKISNVFYNILKKDTSKILYQTKNFVLTKNKLAINLLDSHDVRDFSDDLFIPAIKFLIENPNDKSLYTHCQLGISRSASTIFMFLVIKGVIDNNLSFEQALEKYVKDIYPFMKVNLGVYTYLKNNYPFYNIKSKLNTDWKDLK
ncbi:dual specificity phosphatase, catalytic domain protein [Mycoplasma mycoides subsp. capri]|uniref:dual specificity phosphatase, catalytic domain protein n=1 Tax=Mycoplasma mycoides TaxID=2102 RepID=UPI00223F3256|nr:dual specificity phosphatase, catalytic domain protein [Mycoplasma mycoides]UZK64348.1 dual specificity phosphatase, catalytic domain protein [Mycoplasma mycoides subsp. capri]